jgi:PRTRC genetic system protein F
MRDAFDKDFVLDSGVEADFSAERSVRPLGLADQLFQGCICLPELSVDIPLELSDDDLPANCSFARLALAMQKLGIDVPDEPFVSMSAALPKQLNTWLQRICGDGVQLNLLLTLVGTSDLVAIKVEAQPDLAVFSIEKLTTELEKLQTGLGRWALAVIQRAANRYPIYTPRDIVGMIEYIQPFGNTDKEVAEEFNAVNGETLTVDETRDNYQLFWPSDLINSADGNGWIYGLANPGDAADSPAPKPLQQSGIDKLMRKKHFASVKGVLADFLALDRFLEQHHQALSNPHARFGDTSSYDGQEDDQYQPPLGSTSLMIWGEQIVGHLHLDVLEHFEQLQMQDSGSEVHRSIVVNTKDPIAMDKGIENLGLFFQMHALVGRAIVNYKEI